MKKFVLTRSYKEADKQTIKRILVRCPTTCLLSPTGEEVLESAWAKATLKLPKLVCSHCGQIHKWTKKDVVLAR